MFQNKTNPELSNRITGHLISSFFTVLEYKYFPQVDVNLMKTFLIKKYFTVRKTKQNQKPTNQTKPNK